MTEHPARTPYCTKIRYGITGAPETTGMEGSYASGLSIDPTLVELVYSTAREGRPASLSASVRGWVMRNGARINPDDPDDQMLVHFKNGPHGWPAWLTEEARLHDPAAATVPASAPTDQAAKARSLLLHFAAEAHRRKWAYDRGLNDDGVPVKSEAFDALHRLGDEMRTALDKLRLADAASGPGRAAGETQQDGRPRCPHCQMPHDLTPDVAAVCASIRASIAADEAQQPECACDPEPHREDDGTYSHWAGCPVADVQQAEGEAQQDETRKACACGQDGCEYCDVEDEDEAEELPGPDVVAYRNSDRPGVLLCREHGDGWWGLTPLTSDDLPDGGTCTYGDPADPNDVCGRDVLIAQPAAVSQPGKEA